MEYLRNYKIHVLLLVFTSKSMMAFVLFVFLAYRLGLMFLGGLVLASFMTYASEHLGIRFFLRGLEEKDIPRTNRMCFLC